MKSGKLDIYSAEERDLVAKVRRLTENAPFFEELLVVFFQQQTKYAALSVAGQDAETDPKDISRHIFDRERDAYFDKSLIELTKQLSQRTKTIYAALASLGLAATTYGAVKSESYYVALVLFISFIWSSVLGLDKFARMNIQNSSVRRYVEDYYGLLKEFHGLSQKLMSVPPNELADSHYQAMDLLGQLDTVVRKIETVVTKNALTEAAENYSDGDRESGVFSTKKED